MTFIFSVPSFAAITSRRNTPPITRAMTATTPTIATRVRFAPERATSSGIVSIRTGSPDMQRPPADISVNYASIRRDRQSLASWITGLLPEREQYASCPYSPQPDFTCRGVGAACHAEAMGTARAGVDAVDHDTPGTSGGPAPGDTAERTPATGLDIRHRRVLPARP